jgi:hypothetical protein
MLFILIIKGCEEEIHIIQRFLTFSPMNLLQEQLSEGGVVGVCTNLMKLQEGAGVDLLCADSSVCFVFN